MNHDFNELEFANHVIQNKIKIEKEIEAKNNKNNFIDDLEEGFKIGFTAPFRFIGGLINKAGTTTLKEVVGESNINMYIIFAVIIFFILLKR